MANRVPRSQILADSDFCLKISSYLSDFTRSTLEEHNIISDLEIFGLLAVHWIFHVSNITFFLSCPTSIFEIE